MNFEEKPAQQECLEAVNLYKKYGSRLVVDGVSLKVEKEEIVGLLGPNGSGKTTTFHMIGGFIKPTSGEIFLSGKKLNGLPVYQRARLGIVYLPQEPSIFRKLTVLENLLIIYEQLGLNIEERERKAYGLLEEFGIANLSKQRADTLSGGERRRVEIARALTLEPKFLLLDEPFVGIDPITVLEIQRIIYHLKLKKIGILITDHNVRETLKITDRAYIINNGRIFKEGSPSYLSQDEEVKKIYLGDSFTLN